MLPRTQGGAVDPHTTFPTTGKRKVGARELRKRGTEGKTERGSVRLIDTHGQKERERERSWVSGGNEQ